MITAYNITDEQIRELYERGEISLDTATLCLSTSARRSVFLQSDEWEERKANRADARARCAEILNAHAGR